jgi:toxin ParE1/3/4
VPDKRKLIWAPGALDDLIRLREFLEPNNPKAAKNAAKSIVEAANLLLDHPHLGRPMDDMPEFNQLPIPFGQRGYVLRYRIDGDKIIILRIWHTREDR